MDESATAGMDFKVLKSSVIVFQVVEFCCLSPQFVQLRRSSSQTKNFAKAVVNMADAVRALFTPFSASYS